VAPIRREIAATIKKGSKGKTEAMKHMLANIKKEWGMLGMIDVR
jgi:hypothetical protein